MSSDTLKKDLKILADAQLAFELNGWNNIGSIQKELQSNSLEWGTVYEKNGRTFYLNILSASKALQLLGRAD